MFTHSHLATAVSILKTYNGAEPFHLYLKTYYGHFKKFGSRDRKAITQLCYCWLRAGRALAHLKKEEQVVYALFLCSETQNSLLEELSASLNEKAAKPLREKLKIAEEQAGFSLQALFPWIDALSPEISPPLFNQSLLIQPNLYLRLRPGKEALVMATLQNHGIAFEKISAHCFSISNNTKIDSLLNLDTDVVVQDQNSQHVLDLVKEHGHLKNFTVWDCCAASGGKTLLLIDTFSNVHVTVSDVRANILHNLRKRFQQAGVQGYQWFVSNAATDAPPQRQKFDLIICDAPCTGSGTWSRTPEQLHYFQQEKLETYAQLQKSIVKNVAQYLKPGGLLLYATCSVFSKENEDVVTFISEKCGLNVLKSAYYKGYESRADTLFAALFKAL